MAHPVKISRGVKLRGHHNNEGRAHVRSGRTTDDIMALAKKLGLKYKTKFAAQREKDRLEDQPKGKPHQP
jgi:hypothetical protein